MNGDQVPAEAIVSFVSRQDIVSLPDTIPHPSLAVAAGAVTAFAMWGSMEAHKRSIAKNAPPVVFPGAASLQLAADRVRGDVPGSKLRSRLERMRPVLAAVLGIGVATAGYASGAEKVDVNSSRNAQVVAVVDSSTTMLQTKDIDGKPRFRTAMEAIKDNSDYRGRAAIVDVALQVDTRVPMSSDWRSNIGDTGKSAVDPNGGDLAGGVTRAVQQLPVKREKGKAPARRGVIMLVSDGTGISTEDELATVARDPANKNIKFKIIVPGTEKGTYAQPGSKPVPAGVKPQTFAAFSKDSVTEVDTADELKNAVHSDMRAAGTTTETGRWKVPFTWGAGILAFGLFSGGRRIIKKTQ